MVGTGANEPISAATSQVVGDEELAKIAGELGVSEGEAAAAVAQVLPAVVDGSRRRAAAAGEELARARRARQLVPAPA